MNFDTFASNLPRFIGWFCPRHSLKQTRCFSSRRMTRNYVPDMQIHRKWEGWGQGLGSPSEQLGGGNLCDLLTSYIMGSPPPPLNRETRPPKTLKLVATSFVILHIGIFSTTSQEAIHKKHATERTLLTSRGGGGGACKS